MDQLKFIDYCLNHPLVTVNGQEKTYKKGTLLTTAGAEITKIGIVTKGVLKTCNYTRVGKELCSTIFDQGSVVLEYLHLMKKRYYTFDLIAVSPCTICWIPIKIFDEIALNNQQGLALYVEHLAHRGMETQRLVSCLGYKTIRERICYWIASSNNNLELNQKNIPKNIKLPGSQELFSALLHVTRASISQELNRMEAEGFFTRNRNVLSNVNDTKILATL